VRILCVCDRGVSRSPTIAALLMNKGHEAISLGCETSSQHTRRILAAWADKIILTDLGQRERFSELDGRKTEVWPIADAYPRPHNPKLRLRVLREIRDRKL